MYLFVACKSTQQDIQNVGHNYDNNAYYIDTSNGERKSCVCKDSWVGQSPVSHYRIQATARKTYKLCITLPLRWVLSSGVPAQKVDNAESWCRSRPHIDTNYNRFEYDIDGLMQERRDSFATHCSKIFLALIHEYGCILRAVTTRVMRLFVYIGKNAHNSPSHWHGRIREKNTRWHPIVSSVKSIWGKNNAVNWYFI